MIFMNNRVPQIRVTCPKCKRISFLVDCGVIPECELCHWKWKPDNPFWLDWKFNIDHQKAADNIYKQIWNIESIERELGDLDRERGIDVKLNLINGLTIEIQEKFRRPEYRHYWQFTVEYQNNPDMNEPGEFHHLSANYYFYGYSNGKSGFSDWWIIDLNKFKDDYNNHLLFEDGIKNNYERSNASFLYFSWQKREIIKTIFRCSDNSLLETSIKLF